MQRRGFLKGFGVAATGVAAGGVPYGIARLMAPAEDYDPRNHIRLPGALKDEAAFVAACIGCGLCGEVCPPRCIRFHKTDGAGALNTPYIDPEYKACILCGKCMAVCPTEALTVTLRDEIDMGIAQIDRSACYPWVDQGICGACVSICPLGGKAIGFKMWNQYRPLVKTACVGCGLCVEACPHPSLPIRIVERAQGTVTRHSI